jgi:ATP-dependent protease ClpP protease subunit
MVEVNGTELISVLNQTLSTQSEQFQHTQDSYMVYIILSMLMSSVIYFFFLGRPVMTALAWHVKAKHLLRSYVKANPGRGVIIMTHAQTGIFGTMITMQDALKIEKLIRKFRASDTQIDFIINTFGGDLFASIRIAHLLKSTPGMRVIVPKYAWSGGSLISIAASKLLANPTTIFGAVDPQLGNLLWAFSAKGWKHIVETKQKELQNGASVGAKDDSIAMAQMSEQLMVEMTNYLNGLIEDKKSINKEKFFDYFLNGEHTHGHILSPADLKECGLEVEMLTTDIPDQLIEKMYNVSGVFGYGKGVHVFDD